MNKLDILIQKARRSVSQEAISASIVELEEAWNHSKQEEEWLLCFNYFNDAQIESYTQSIISKEIDVLRKKLN
jgi:hypothetical protein